MGTHKNNGNSSLVVRIHKDTRSNPPKKNRKNSKRLGKMCIYFNKKALTCKLTKKFCSEAYKCRYYERKGDSKKICYTKTKISPKFKRQTHPVDNIGITAIVLNDNRNCIIKKHAIKDVKAKIRVADRKGKVICSTIAAGYCKELV